MMTRYSPSVAKSTTTSTLDRNDFFALLIVASLTVSCVSRKYICSYKTQSFGRNKANKRSRRKLVAVESSETPLQKEFCARCGREIDPEEHYEVVGDQRVKICRVEHIVGWVMRGAKWQDGTTAQVDAQLTLIRKRSGLEITDVFGSPEALRAWASAGGPWGKSSAM